MTSPYPAPGGQPPGGPSFAKPAPGSYPPAGYGVAPAAPPQGSTPPGWYPGPSGGPQWWDGRQWGPPAPPAADNSNTMAMFCYLGMLIVGFLVPLIILLTEGKKSRFVKHHATEALNWSITAVFLSFALLAAYIVALVLGLGAGVSTGDAGAGLFAGFGVFVIIIVIVVVVAIAFGIASLVFTIIGAVKASQRKYWRYPFAIRLVKGAASKAEVDALNRGVV